MSHELGPREASHRRPGDDAIALITLTSEGRKIAMMTTASTKDGIVRKKSVMRISSASTHFP